MLISVLKAGGNSLKSYKAVEGSIKWDDIKLDGKSPEDCKAMYQFLMSKVSTASSHLCFFCDLVHVVVEMSHLTEVLFCF